MIKIQTISKIFKQGANDINKALDELTLTINENDFITVIGGNGAGKSTLINCISGLHTINSGKIKIDNMDITRLPVYKRSKFIGFVFQDPLKATAPNMTIRENLAIASMKNRFHGLKFAMNRKQNELFKTKLEMLGLGLENKLDYKVGLLSGGQRQALSLLMSTLITPKLLLLDEHTSALDPYTSNKVLDITNELVNKNHIPTIMITHNMENAIQYGNKIIMMDKGKIILTVEGREKENMNVENLLDKFHERMEQKVFNDRMLL